MFIRFSNQEQINVFAPAADNSAGTQRLQDGTRIMGAIKGKENILGMDRQCFIFHEICRVSFYIWL